MRTQDTFWKVGISIAAALLLLVPLLATEASGRAGGGGGGGGWKGGGGGGGWKGAGGGGGWKGAGGGGGWKGGGGPGVRSFSASRSGASKIGGRSFSGTRFTGHSRASTGVRSAAAKGSSIGGPGSRFVGGSPRTFSTAAAHSRPANLARANSAFGNKVIANAAFHSSILRAPTFSGRFHGSHWPWWHGGIVIGWIGPVFWPYAYDDFFDYVFWPYAYDGFWPYAYEDVYYGIYGPYAYVDPSAKAGRPRTARGSERRVVGVCSENAPELTDWPIERISQVVEPFDAQRAALDELKGATSKAIEILKAACPNDLPSIPTGRLAAMESRLRVMLAAVQTVRPPLDRFYQLLSDEQKARFNVLAPTDTSAAVGKDRRDLTRLCTERSPGITDLPIERIAQAVRPTDAQRASLDELKVAAAKASDGLKGNCPAYQALTPTGRVEAMEKRLEAMLEAEKTVQPALASFYNGLSDEQKARFNALGSTRPGA
jgi:LTXXQ motif family protein